MTNSDAFPEFDPANVDFEQVYRSGTLGAGLVMERLPWDIGRPQPLLVEVEAAGRVAGSVLDIGCGPGDTTIFLAGRGHSVLGLDISPTALEQARSRASEQQVAASFEVADATQLSGYEGRFDTVVSSALLHCLPPDGRTAHVAALHRVLRPGGRLIQFCFARADHEQPYAPFPIGEEELRTSFAAPEWQIDSLRSGSYLAVMPAQAEQVMRAAHAGGEQLEIDDNGFLLLPVWSLEAVRV